MSKKIDLTLKKEHSDSEDPATDARNRFQGELLKLNESDHSSDSDESKKPRKANMKKQRKTKGNQSRDDVPSHYVMKMYDRSINLAEFNLNTPLYPICRAWFQNNPHSSNRWKPKEEKKEKRHENDIVSLPPPAERSEKFIPSPLPAPQLSDDFTIDYDSNSPNLPSKDDLMSEHRSRWLSARSKTLRDCTRRSKRYARSIAVLTAIYTPPL